MLMFTNREVDIAKTDETAFSNRFTVMDLALGHAEVQGVYQSGGGASWTLSRAAWQAADGDIVARLVEVFSAARPVLVYLHGNDTTPARAFYRCKRLEDLYGVSVIGFSWTSEGLLPDGSEGMSMDATRLATDDDEQSLRHVSGSNLNEGWIKRKIIHYRRAKNNAQDSTLAVARFLRLVAVARLFAGVHQPYSIAGHSLGCFLLQKTLALPGVYASVASADNLVLLAACTRAAQHRAWVETLSPKDRVYIVFNVTDPVLAAANIADSGEVKLGLDPGVDIVRSPKFRYVDFWGPAAGRSPHSCFVADHPDRPRKAALKFFTAVFRSDDDFPAGGDPKSMYLAGCNGDLSICSMAFH